MRAVVPIGAAAVTATAAVVVLASVSPWAGAALAVGWVVAAVVAPWCAVRGAAMVERSAAQARDDAAALTMTLLWHAAELEVAGRREGIAARAAAAEDRARRAADAGTRVRSWAAGVLPTVSGACLLVACIVGLVTAGSVDATTVGVLILLPLSVFETAAPLVDASRQLHRSRDAASRVLAVVHAAGRPTTTDDVRPVERSTPHRGRRRGRAVGSRGTSTRRPDRRWPHLGAGSRVAVVGPSGSGKTTLLATIAGLIPPVDGAVLLRDASGDADPREAVRWFASDAHVFATSIRENLLVARGDADDARLWDALDRVGLGAWVRGLDGGLDHLVVSGADAMSTGQRRRLLLARALICPVPVLLLDEPCENVDPDEADALTAALLDPCSGLVEPDRAVVVVTHRLPTACRADRVIELGGEGSLFRLGRKAVADSGIRA